MKVVLERGRGAAEHTLMWRGGGERLTLSELSRRGGGGLVEVLLLQLLLFLANTPKWVRVIKSSHAGLLLLCGTYPRTKDALHLKAQHFTTLHTQSWKHF